MEYNKTVYNTNTYTDVYTSSSNTPWSNVVEQDIEYELHEMYLTVSSRDRDVAQYPKSNTYTLQFPIEFKNVYSIELIQGIIPDQNSVTNEPYLLLKIAELEDLMVSNDRNISDAFAILQLSKPTATGTFIQIDKRIHENVIKYYKTPKATLSKMTISITDVDGIPFDFGGDSTLTKAYQNTFVFKIVCMEKKRAVLQHRNVF